MITPVPVQLRTALAPLEFQMCLIIYLFLRRFAFLVSFPILKNHAEFTHIKTVHPCQYEHKHNSVTWH
jgi:hypothetical protein